MKRTALAALLVLAAMPASALAGRVRSGTIVVGHGVAGANLGMTRAQVIGVLGKPVYENHNGVMDYQPIPTGNVFEFFRGRHSHKVNGIQLDGHGSGFKLADGNAIFTHGGQHRLFKHYGHRLHQNPVVQGQRSYNLYGRFHGRRVVTTFLVSKFSHTSGKVYEVDLGYRR
jgi:hypothetical protein